MIVYKIFSEFFHKSQFPLFHKGWRAKISCVMYANFKRVRAESIVGIALEEVTWQPCLAIMPHNLFHSLEKITQHALASDGHCYSFAIALALVLFKYNAL